jgi:hypothetical protein
MINDGPCAWTLAMLTAHRSALSGGPEMQHNSAQRATQSALKVWTAPMLSPSVSNSSGGPHAAPQTPAVKLHRARQFTCYADIPGVGGGRDIPYARYDNLSLHDQGAETWFIDKDGRNLGLRLFNVDWPINNYDGYFTRDSLVIYVIEKLDDGSTKEHGYAFTLPEANRIGNQP